LSVIFNHPPMETKILDDKGYPFEITPEAITTNFALFQKLRDNRSQLILALSKGDIAGIIEEHESHNSDKCIARGYYSYAGTQPRLNKWVSEVKTEGLELSPTELAALRSDIWTEVNKLFKGEVSDEQVTSQRKMTDVAYDMDNEQTHPAHVSFLDRYGDATQRHDIQADVLTPNSEIVIQSIHSRPSHNKASA